MLRFGSGTEVRSRGFHGGKCPGDAPHGTPSEGSVMYSIFYLIGVIVVILAVLRLIA